MTADRERLRQVLANLVDNAIKYTPAGGQVHGERRARGRSVVRIDVTDTGIGIAAEDLPRIWERLYRGDHSRAERGLGLGLEPGAGDRRRPRRARSRSSEPGRGSTFTVRLPADRPNSDRPLHAM